jgi:phosphoglycerate dehydrogenase-like enzyme
VLITAHVAGHSPRFLERGYTLVRRQVERVRAGEPLANVVYDGY